jgi:hypothetical protein
MSLVIGVTPIREPNQKHSQRYPGELVPIKERKTEEDGIVEIVERHRQQGYERYQQQSKAMLDHASSPFGRAENGAGSIIMPVLSYFEALTKVMRR